MQHHSYLWRVNVVILMLAIFAGAGCTGINSFGLAARPGDTVVLALGWQLGLTRQDVTVAITDSSSATFVYPPGDPSVRAIINTYPDPVSRLFVGAETGQPNFEGASTGIATDLIDNSVTDGDKDYAQTFLILDLPAGMSLGTASIDVTDSIGSPIPNPSIQAENINPIAVEIVGGVGESNSFSAQEGLTVLPGYLAAMERAGHRAVSFQGSATPYAIQVDMTHNPDKDMGGVGKAYVAIPRGDILSLFSSDDGVNLRVILMTARGQVSPDLKKYKFYVAGGITGLVVGGVTAYDVNGVLIPNITAVMN